jgi:anthranilate synthase/aminodeoxychorismate synthase-like glutamine amidotransferase
VLLLIDNYDSFTYNLARYFVELHQDVKVVRNDEITIDQISQLNPNHIVLSPGPCTPNESGICIDVVKAFAGHIPILGVCLGHQAIAQAYGATITQSHTIKHGKTSEIQHKGSKLFLDVPKTFTATRYHSLVIQAESLPDAFSVTAWVSDIDDDGRTHTEIMAIEHKQLPICGVQFHPESLLTEFGHQILNNFTKLHA